MADHVDFEKRGHSQEGTSVGQRPEALDVLERARREEGTRIGEMPDHAVFDPREHDQAGTKVGQVDEEEFDVSEAMTESIRALEMEIGRQKRKKATPEKKAEAERLVVSIRAKISTLRKLAESMPGGSERDDVLASLTAIEHKVDRAATLMMVSALEKASRGLPDIYDRIDKEIRRSLAGVRSGNMALGALVRLSDEMDEAMEMEEEEAMAGMGQLPPIPGLDPKTQATIEKTFRIAFAKAVEKVSRKYRNLVDRIQELRPDQTTALLETIRKMKLDSLVSRLEEVKEREGPPSPSQLKPVKKVDKGLKAVERAVRRAEQEAKTTPVAPTGKPAAVVQKETVQKVEQDVDEGLEEEKKKVMAKFQTFSTPLVAGGGALVGAGIGFAVGGPIGAVIGFFGGLLTGGGASKVL